MSLFQSVRLMRDGEGVGVEAGPGDHGQNVAVARIHGDDCAVAVAESQFGGALQIVVDGQLQVLARDGVLDAEIADFAAVAVDDDIARSVLAAQQLVVGLFHARLADHVAGFVVGKARVVEVFLTDFAHITDEVSGKAVAGIKAAFLFDGLQLGKFVAMRFNECPLVLRDVLFDGDGLVAGGSAIAKQGSA